MIARYSRSEMSAIWSDQKRYLNWLRVEFAVCGELARVGKIPVKEWGSLKKKLVQLIQAGGVRAERVDHFELTTRHDVIAFTTAVAEQIGPLSRYVHYGLTSSDVVDTALSLTLQEAGMLLRDDCGKLLKVLKQKALTYQKLPTIGRSHGIFAEPTSFGLKYLGWYCEWIRNLERLKRALQNLSVGKLSGAVGVNAHWGPSFESKVLKSLGLRREPVATQVIPRDRHAELLNVIGICGSSLERIAVELRHLQRSEVAEVYENFQKGQKGSSAMPHKKNPISSENISGCARLLRAYAQTGNENVPLWHERDISHSAVERVAFADAMILLDYALSRMTRVLDQLVVREDQVRANLENAGSTVFSGHFLLALVEAGASREDAYSWVQSCALESFASKQEFLALMSKHPEVKKYLSANEILNLGSIKYQLRNVREIYEKVFKEKSI